MSRMPLPHHPGEQPIAALIPSASTELRPVPAPVGDLPATPAAVTATATAIAIARLNRSGQINVRTALSALGWAAGDRIAITVRHGAVVIVATDHSRRVIGADSSLVLPVAVRRMCAIPDRSSVLVAALPDPGLLVIHPIATVIRLLSARHTRIVRSSDDRA